MSLKDTVLQHRHALLGVEGYTVGELEEIFMARVEEFRRRIPSMWRYRWRVRQLIMEALAEDFTHTEVVLSSLLRKLTFAEAKAVRRIIQQYHKQFTAKLPDEWEAGKIVEAPINGVTFRERVQLRQQRSMRRMLGVLGLAALLGDTGEEAAERITKDYSVWVFAWAATLGRTEVQRVANDTVLFVYRQQPNIIPGVEWSAVLDARTCAACSDLDGTTYLFEPGHGATLDDAPRMPLHARCRCVWVPIEVEVQGERESYAQWLRRQPEEFIRAVLRGKYEWFRQGKWTPRNVADAVGEKSAKRIAPSELAEI